MIKRTRLDSGLKQEVFAREVGVVAAHLSRLEHGQGLPSIQLIQKIADRFGADRSRMLRLLRTIKGFEEEEEDSRRASRMRVPVVAASAVPRWVEEFLSDGRAPAADLPSEPISREMSRDKRAFWVPANGPTMCGGAIYEWDLLLVEPSHPPMDGRPALILIDGDVHVRRWRVLQGRIFLEPLCEDQPALPTLSPADFEARGGKAFRLAGFRPAFRSFLGHDGKAR